VQGGAVILLLPGQPGDTSQILPIQGHSIPGTSSSHPGKLPVYVLIMPYFINKKCYLVFTKRWHLLHPFFSKKPVTVNPCVERLRLRNSAHFVRLRPAPCCSGSCESADFGSYRLFATRTVRMEKTHLKAKLTRKPYDNPVYSIFFTNTRTQILIFTLSFAGSYLFLPSGSVLRSSSIFMLLRLRVKIVIRLPLPHIAKNLFFYKERKLTKVFEFVAI
jgi:hypothetical protein